MRRNNTQNISEVVSALLKEMNIDHKLKEVRVINSWEEVMGTKIARSTTKLFVKNRVLFVYLQSSVIRNELMMLKTGIIKALNDRAGEAVIDDIVMR
jgi:predicted nucleic acid-binding Zn ribbon protein